jgi:hypothetical protein
LNYKNKYFLESTTVLSYCFWELEITKLVSSSLDVFISKNVNSFIAPRNSLQSLFWCQTDVKLGGVPNIFAQLFVIGFQGFPHRDAFPKKFSCCVFQLSGNCSVNQSLRSFPRVLQNTQKLHDTFDNYSPSQ